MKALFSAAVLCGCALLSACNNKQKVNEIHFSTSAEYPPFEYSYQGKLTGFDIDLATLLAQQLGKKAVFDNMQFSHVITALLSGQDEAAIATLTITDARQKNVDFTLPYYFSGMVVLFKPEQLIKDSQQLQGKKIGCQLGSTMEIWLKKTMPASLIVTMDTNNQAIAALQAGYVDAVVMDETQGYLFQQKNPGLVCQRIGQAANGYAIAVKKGSPLIVDLNKALAALKQQGKIKILEQKWLAKVAYHD